MQIERRNLGCGDCVDLDKVRFDLLMRTSAVRGGELWIDCIGHLVTDREFVANRVLIVRNHLLRELHDTFLDIAPRW